MARKQKITEAYTKKQIARFIAIVISAIVICIISFFPNMPTWGDVSIITGANSSVVEKEGYFYAHYIDVGQADCELLKCGDDVVLIDAGETDSFKTISAYLDMHNVTEIDYFIVTHAHSDHIGAADEIIRNYNVSNVIMTRLTQENTPTSSVYRDLLNAISDTGVKVYVAVPGDEYKLENFSFNIIAPNDDYSDLNNTSIVVKAIYKQNSFLFQGDAETKSEKDILEAGFDVSADVIKLGHHGSRTSSSLEYLERVNPQVAIVSCGVNNRYNHPNPETVAKLNKLGVVFFRTDASGNIVIESDGTEFSVHIEKE